MSRTSLHHEDEPTRIEAFGRAVDALRREAESSLGPEDLEYIRGVRTVSTGLEVAGRVLIHVSLEPVSFGLGVLALSTHKALEAMEIGHTVLHGAYDRLEGSDLKAAHYRWKAPIDEESWRTAHNIKHHQYTNVAHRDPDLDFGSLRLSARVPAKLVHRLQPASNLLTWAAFTTAINLHATGLLEVYLPGDSNRVLPDRRWKTLGRAHVRFFRKVLRYHGREYVLFPALAGPFFWKVLLGNVLSEVARDLYTGATIYCGHVGAQDYPEDSRARSRSEFYVRQVEGSCDFEVPLVVSILCGGLDRQIEHHLFPRLPPNRLRRIAPKLRAICEAHGVQYRTDTWPRRLREVMGTLRRLGRGGERSQEARPSRDGLRARSTPTPVPAA